MNFLLLRGVCIFQPPNTCLDQGFLTQGKVLYISSPIGDRQVTGIQLISCFIVHKSRPWNSHPKGRLLCISSPIGASLCVGKSQNTDNDKLLNSARVIDHGILTHVLYISSPFDGSLHVWKQVQPSPRMQMVQSYSIIRGFWRA